MTITTYKTRRGAEDYITRLGYTPGEWANERQWTGQGFKPIRLRFVVTEQVVGGVREFVVVRDVEEVS